MNKPESAPRRSRAGTYVTVSTVGNERVRAFVPGPLPPSPPIEIDGGLRRALDAALVELGRVDGVSAFLPDRNLLLYSYIRKEAVLSSQIEGTQSSLSDLLLAEIDEAPGAPVDDVIEVSNCVAAIEHGVRRMHGGFPLSNRLLREMHEVLLRRGRGADKQPGRFRRSQNWIGGTRPGNAVFVPPPADRVADLMGDLERFIHDPQNSVLLKAALAHVQLETIHPFLDGNGRVGRILITLILVNEGVLSAPMLYLSLFFRQHRQAYYDHLNAVRRDGNWAGWLGFFAEAVIETARSAVETAHRATELFQSDLARIHSLGRRASSAAQVHAKLCERPLASIAKLHELTGMSIPTITRGLEALEGLGIVRETTGRRRGRVYAYDRYLQLLNEGMER
ncbi:MAG: Fic family protein [Gemmatimonas sp.]|nr:Fic family protein [Gemmatimonas sp.]